MSLKLLSELAPLETLWQSEMEGLRFLFGTGIVILTFAKEITVDLVHPSACREMCDAIDHSFATALEKMEADVETVPIAEFLPDLSEQEIFCHSFRPPVEDAAESTASLSTIFAVLHEHRERQYHGDLLAAQLAASKITDGALSVMGELVFVFKRFMLHVYGIRTDLRNRFLEDELFETKFVALCNIIFSQSYDELRSFIEYLRGSQRPPPAHQPIADHIARLIGEIHDEEE